MDPPNQICVPASQKTTQFVCYVTFITSNYIKGHISVFVQFRDNSYFSGKFFVLLTEKKMFIFVVTRTGLCLINCFFWIVCGGISNNPWTKIWTKDLREENKMCFLYKVSVFVPNPPLGGGTIDSNGFFLFSQFWPIDIFIAEKCEWYHWQAGPA